MKTKIDFVNKVVKQGNSLCVRIPSTIVKEGGVKEGTEVLMTIHVPTHTIYEYTEENAKYMYDLAFNVKKLAMYDETKKRMFIALLFAYLKETRHGNPAKLRERETRFIKKARHEFGSRFVGEFVRFCTDFNKEAFIMEGDVAILKKRYRN